MPTRSETIGQASADSERRSLIGQRHGVTGYEKKRPLISERDRDAESQLRALCSNPTDLTTIESNIISEFGFEGTNVAFQWKQMPDRETLLKMWNEVVYPLLKPMHLHELKDGLSKAYFLCKTRTEDGEDVATRIALYAEELKDVPDDVMKDVIRVLPSLENGWFPSMFEINKAVEWRMRRRNALVQLIGKGLDHAVSE